MSRVSIFNKYGYFVGDIRVSTTRSWIRNATPQPGECVFNISIYDPKATRKYLEFGNFVLVRHSTLPDWVGVIVARKWGEGYVGVTALQAEYVLQKRVTPVQTYKGTAGSLFAQVLLYTNSMPFNEKPIIPLNIYYSQPERNEKLGNNALVVMQKIAGGAKNDFEISHKIDVNGRLYLAGNWYEDRGIVTNKVLSEGYNIEVSDGLLTEDIRDGANFVEGVGDASTTGTRLVVTAFDETSINTYGLNQVSVVFSGIKDRATVTTNTVTKLIQSKEPSRIYDVTAINVGTTFNFLNIGNTMKIDYNRAGFVDEGLGYNGDVVIQGMEYSDDADTCRLVLEKA